MNPFHPSHHQAVPGRDPPDPPFYPGPKIPRRPQNHSEPAFMQPLLPPHQHQSDPIYAPGPSSSCSPVVHTPPDFYPQPVHAFQGHLSARQLQNFHSQGIASCVPDHSDEDYPLEFASFDAFQRWRLDIENRETVEFVKSDTYRSKTVSPSVNELAKLACSRNFKNARSKYANTLPERNRSVSASQRNIEADGCPASISYRTYFGTPTVRAKYFNQHSHPIGRDNLPFTRRGRNIAEHERRTQQQNGFFTTNAVMDGTMPSAASIPIASNNREVRNMDAVRIEPPPMASLKPPDSSAKEFAATSVPAAVDYPQKQQQQHHIGYIQVSPPPDSRLPCPPTTLQQDGAPAPGLVSQPHPSFDQSRADVIPGPPDAPFPVPPIARSHGRSQAYRAPPPLAPAPPPSYDLNTNAPVHHPQPSYLPHTTEALNHQAQYLPTPTTPSTQIQNLHPYTFPYPYSEALSRREPPETQNQAAAPLSNGGSHVSPLSPVTPQTQNLHGPPGPPPPSAIDVRTTPAPQYSPRDVYSFDEVRWNRLDALFQAVRLRARSRPFPEAGIGALEALLYRLYMEGQQLYSRPAGDQPPTYQQQQQQQLQQAQQLQ